MSGPVRTLVSLAESAPFSHVFVINTARDDVDDDATRSESGFGPAIQI